MAPSLPPPVRRALDRIAPGGDPLDELRRALGAFRHPSTRGIRALRTAPRRRPGEVRFEGAPFRYVDGPSFYFQVRDIFVRREYDLAPPGGRPRILDCGGNIGTAARRFRLRHPGAELTVLEADPELAEVLRENLRAAGDDATEVISAAAWERDGTVSFRTTGTDTGFVTDDGGALPCVDISSLCDEPVDLLKLDVEGAEATLVRRLHQTGALDRVHRIVCEVHERGGTQTLTGVLATLADAGFTCRALGGRAAPDFDASPSGSGFAALPCLGALGLVYAWREG